MTSNLKSVSLSQAELPGSTATVIGLVVFALVVFDVGWLVVRHVAVMAHAGAHALTGLLVFRRVPSIELDAGTDLGFDAGLRAVPVVLAGYLGPSAFGLGAAKLIELRHAPLVLWLVLILLAVVVIGLRRTFGLISVLVAVGVVFGIAQLTPMHVQVISAYSVSWLLLLSGVRRVLDGGIRLRDSSGLPHVLWSVFWLAVTLAAAAEGARLLIG
jgi:hypothetical protein